MSSFHTGAWVLWLAAALAPAAATGNPAYLALALAAVGVAYAAQGRGGGEGTAAGSAAAGWGAFLRLGLVLVGFSVLVQPLLVKAGATTLFTLPSVTWRPALFGRTLGMVEIGGRVTLESVVYGGARGLALLTVLLAFATFNTRVDHYQLLRGIPRFLYQSGIVVSIALAFVPQMLVAQREIREAQALRGHRFRGLRDLVPLFVALVAEGLERAIDLAESMEARGFGYAGAAGAGAEAGAASAGGGAESGPGGGRWTASAGGVAEPGPRGGRRPAAPGTGGRSEDGREGAPACAPLRAGTGRPAQGVAGARGELPGAAVHRPLTLPRAGGINALLIVALVLLLAGVWARSVRRPAAASIGVDWVGWAGWAASAVGGFLLVGALVAVGRRVRRSRFRREAWRRRDTLLVGASLAVLVGFAVARILGRPVLVYYPYPRLTMPPFDVGFGAVLVLLAAPAVLAGVGRVRQGGGGAK